MRKPFSLTLPQFFDLFFRDPARPVEWLSLFALLGWGLSMAVAPEVLRGDSYAAFRAMPAWIWAVVMIAVAGLQLFAMLPVGVRAATRFVAMACASGLWTIVAIHFIAASVPTTGIGTYTALAAITALTGVWLGWTAQQSRS